jgi:hypothetical protein
MPLALCSLLRSLLQLINQPPGDQPALQPGLWLLVQQWRTLASLCLVLDRRRRGIAAKRLPAGHQRLSQAGASRTRACARPARVCIRQFLLLLLTQAVVQHSGALFTCARCTQCGSDEDGAGLGCGRAGGGALRVTAGWSCLFPLQHSPLIGHEPLPQPPLGIHLLLQYTNKRSAQGHRQPPIVRYGG